MLLRSTVLLASAWALVCIPFAALAQNPAAADRYPIAEVQLSDETLQLRYVDTTDWGEMENTRVAGTFFLSEQRDVVLSAGAQFPTNFELGPLSLTFGPQVYAALLEDENSDVFALSIGTEVRFDLIPSMDVAVTGQAYYAPDITSFGAADNMLDLSARLEVGLAERLVVFGGVRLFEFDLTEGRGERTLQDELFAGFGYRF